MTAIARKISRHCPTSRMSPPSRGATIGAIPPTPCMMFMIRNSSGPSVMSISTARPSTMPKPPPIPCTTRMTSSRSTVGARAQPIEPSRHSTMPNSSGARRPIRSERGPATTCPLAVPTKKAVRVSCMRAAVVARSCSTCGKAGMYMSVASGPIALRVVSTTIIIAVTLLRVRLSSCSEGRRARSWSAASSSTGIEPVMVGIEPVMVGISPVTVGVWPVTVGIWPDVWGSESSGGGGAADVTGVLSPSRAGQRRAGRDLPPGSISPS